MVNMTEGQQQYGHKRVLVLGAARSGIAAAHLLLDLGAEVVLNDRNLPKDGEVWDKELSTRGVEVIVGEHPPDLLSRGFDLIVKNPGIPYTQPYLLEAEQQGIPIITEIELGYVIHEGLLIGITGSNGKTTTTTLVGEICSVSNPDTIVAGNIGKVFSEQVRQSKPSSVIVTELSSFQLKGTIHFRPHIACLLNLYEHHLDYHQTKEDYQRSKYKLFQNQTSENFALLNWDQAELRDLARACKAQVFWFSRKEIVENGSFVANHMSDQQDQRWIFFKRKEDAAIPILPLSELALIGEHNLENVLAAVTITMLAEVPIEDIQKVLKSFGGVEHRLEFVTEKSGVRYYNDSKATNPEATEQAIKSFTSPLILILGGMERGNHLEELIPLLGASVKGVVAYGETKERFIHIAEVAGVKQIGVAPNVEEATLIAAKMAEAGDVVLLSPACASWDLYSSFEERGRMFKNAVHSL